MRGRTGTNKTRKMNMRGMKYLPERLKVCVSLNRGLLVLNEEQRWSKSCFFVKYATQILVDHTDRKVCNIPIGNKSNFHSTFQTTRSIVPDDLSVSLFTYDKQVRDPDEESHMELCI